MKNSARPTLPAEDLSVICSQLALMQKAGIGTEDAVALILEDAPEKHRAVLTALVNALSQGEAFDAALDNAGVFPPYMVRMVSIGLLSGTLDSVLKALSVYYRREAETVSALRRTAIYPSFMAVLIAAVFLVLMSRVLPVFQQVFSQLGMSLSPAAQTMLKIGSVSRQMSYVFFVVLTLAALFVLFVMKTQRGAMLGTRLTIKLFSSLEAYKAVDRGRFANAMSLMLASGLSLDDAIEKTEELFSGGALQPSVQKCRALMENGVLFPNAIKEAGLYSGLETGLVSAGFRVGAVETAMEELAVRAQEDMQEKLSSLLGRFELALVLILCVSVGLVLLSVMMPLLGVMASIGG